MKGKTLADLSIRFGLPTLIVGLLALWVMPSGLLATTPTNLNWPNYGNDLHNTRFQDVDLINRSNVKNLAPAWVFHTKVLDPLGELQVAPIVIDGRMFVTDLAGSVYSARLNGSEKRPVLFAQGNLTGVAYAEILPKEK